jgi:hypothetical protein
MSAPPALPPITNPQPLIRLWDAEWNLRGVVNPDDIIRDNGSTPGRVRLTYRADHVVSQWVIEETSAHRPPFMTVDENGGRWIARLDGWQMRKAGPCPQCAHCQQTMLDTDWVPEPL